MACCFIVQPIHDAGVIALRAAGLEVREPTSQSTREIAASLADADAVITRNAGLSALQMRSAKRLAVIGVHGSGTDPVDIDTATRLGIPVFATPGENAQSVAEQALALMLAVAKNTILADHAVRNGDFNFKYEEPLIELFGKTLGVVGWGRIGKLFSSIAKASLGMDVVIYSPSTAASEVQQKGMRMAESLQALLEESDVVSLHVPFKPDTERLIGHSEFEFMKHGAVLINTGRGQTVDEEAMILALQSGRLRGAGLDVFDSETMIAGHPLLTLKNVTLSPHIGGSSSEALKRTALAVAQGVLKTLRGERPAHLVNPEVWPRRRTFGQSRGSKDA
ncbi:hydroxyacid dehydrogenase [Limibacillus sp. MBR-115]|jgi:D-3-phosphoglycerate dehydrogenase|uniref:hydroxyacid dehydrogenase n=1 Tax=Limibacillus sp. MBR-115 TaxID=3156465 RepID=UPI0033909AE2